MMLLDKRILQQGPGSRSATKEGTSLWFSEVFFVAVSPPDWSGCSLGCLLAPQREEAEIDEV